MTINKWDNIPTELKVKPISLNDENIARLNLTEPQIQLITTLVKEIAEEIQKAKNLLDNHFDASIFSRPLVWMEREASSIIEGSVTLFEDQNNDYIYSIDNIFSWENRNLYELYLKYVDIEPKYRSNFIWNKFSIATLHNMLYDDLLKSKKYRMEFDPTQIIKKIQPGNLNSDDSMMSAFGTKGKPPSLYFIQPSKKEALLDDLLNTIEQKIKLNDEKYPFLLSDIAKFHVIFEGIHPFRDGNGRIGRLLLAMLFQSWKPIASLPHIINLSEFFKENREEYIRLLKQVQLNPENYNFWNDWFKFFVNAIIHTKKNQVYRIKLIAEIYFKAISHPLIKGINVRMKILKDFFMYYKLNRKITIDKFKKEKIQKSEKALYNDFNTVVQVLEAQETENGTFHLTKLSKILRKKQ